MIDRRLNVDRPGAQVFEDVHHQGVFFRQQAEQKVLGANVLVIAAVGFVPRLD